MFDLNVSLFPVSIEGRSFPGIAKRVAEIWWSSWHRNELVRYSISALLRIQVDDKYLLVKNRHFNKYQPVGGVLKRLPHSAHTLSKLGIREDNMFNHDDINRGDLRVHVPARSVTGFLNWYASGVGRELEPWREFYEELVRPGLLPSAVFPFVQTQHIRRHNTGIYRAPHLNNGARYECRIAEIFELLPNEDQRNALVALTDQHDAGILWATPEQIETQGVIPKVQAEAHITDTAKWIL